MQETETKPAAPQTQPKKSPENPKPQASARPKPNTTSKQTKPQSANQKTKQMLARQFATDQQSKEKKKVEKKSYFQKKMNQVMGNPNNNDAITFIFCAIIFAVVIAYFEDPLAKARQKPEYKVMNNHLYDMQSDFSTAMIFHIRKQHQFGVSQKSKRYKDLDSYSLHLMDQILDENQIASHGLEDIIRGGKPKMLLAHKQFIFVKLPINLAMPGNATEEQQLDYEREAAVQFHLLFSQISSATPVQLVEMRHFHPKLREAAQWIERNQVKVKRNILEDIGRSSHDDKRVFSSFKSKVVYRKRNKKLGLTEKYGDDYKLIEDEPIKFIKKRVKKNKFFGVVRPDDWRFEVVGMCPDRFVNAWLKTQYLPTKWHV